ncbi:MAG: phosphoadenylyl-sulfate reductase [Bacteroidales bacterium]|nr:phosphoadenylyl-sulfate reductase [Bacteroidales bacterium]MBN2697897.1 phosphoadenylyl-sulfate reductase [Bacteroidales bacterium]
MSLTETLKRQIEAWNEELKDTPPEQVIEYFHEYFGKRIAFSTSLGAEDQVLTHMVVETGIPARIFTLDTGRLFPETYELIALTNARYKINIEVLFPDYKQVEKMVAEKGINLFYDSVENRKLCCRIRKVEPLKRAFKNLDAWICGLRKDQSVLRFFSKLVEWDEKNGLIKINPLINWNEKQVWEYIRRHDVPYNMLHDKGYPSIGCEPCTRAVEPGEDSRAGRWWWEEGGHRECGLHKK